jgi:transcriptional regulator with XRE-family HTH domain
MYPRLRAFREDRDKNQSEIAELLKVSQTTYSRYETGVLDIPSQSLIKLAKYYDTSIDYLVGLTDEEEPYKRAKNYF